MKHVILLFIFILLVFYTENNLTYTKGSASQPDKKDGNKYRTSDFKVPGKGTFICEPMTHEYFNNLLQSKESFSQIVIDYRLGIDKNHLKERTLALDLRTKLEFQGETAVNKNLSDLAGFDALFWEHGKRIQYSCSIPMDIIQPIFTHIMGQSDFFFDKAEYKKAERLEIRTELEFGHADYISMNIFEPNRKAFEKHSARAFCKGWDPGQEPPEELKPLINYIESTIIPYMLEHQSP